eukprot:3278645-Pyramimonas_sp.AAC.1
MRPDLGVMLTKNSFEALADISSSEGDARPDSTQPPGTEHSEERDLEFASGCLSRERRSGCPRS